MKGPADVVLFATVIVAFLSVTIFAAPSKQNFIESGELKDDLEPVHHHHRHQINFQPRHGYVDPLKETYMLLRSLRKVQGQDGRSPVCAICSKRSVDANTYDYFCLPDSEGMDGEVCDKLTVLGTSPFQRISVGCKQLLTRRPNICK